jgi:competence protein ComEC
LGGWVQNRLKRLFPETAALAIALVWARKDGLDPPVRESFSRAGVAHLLAISGFHVGVVAGVLLLLMGSLGVSHQLRFLLSSLGVWVYVLAIGVPDAALRAALILSALSCGRTLNRAVAPLGALATVFLIFLVIDTGGLLRPGFQLSFAGSSGLIVGYPPIKRWLADLTKGRIPSFLCQGAAAGVAATMATLPLVAWHFDRVSLLGVPLTLIGAPMVALAIPGIFLCLILSWFHVGSASFLASGVDLVLRLFQRAVEAGAGLPFASVWVPQSTVVWGTAALAISVSFLALGIRPRKRSGREKGAPRNQVLILAAATGVLLGPSLSRILHMGTLELVVLDVGQGDAALLRSPGGRWVLVDAGPRTQTYDAGERVVLPYLRRRGVGSLELLILSHPDMDHVGGAPSVLSEFPVGAVMDPGLPAGTEVFLETLGAAQSGAVPWLTLQAGDSLNLDGMALRVLAPEPEGVRSPGEGKNAASLVLEVRYGEFSALLTGDAPADSEERFVHRILSSEVEVLKVGHHGSSTSTTEGLLDRARPELALISAGRRNRFGHPAPDVVRRLLGMGVELYRTDLQGDITVRAGKDGKYRVFTEFR